MTVAMSVLLIEAPFVQLLAILAVVSILAFVARSLLAAGTSRSKSWKSYPCVGLKKQWFPWLRASLRSFTGSEATVAEGYAKYSKSNTPFVVPSLSRGPVVMLFPSQFRDVLNRPEEEVDALGSLLENLQAFYTIGDPEIYLSNIHVNVIRRQLTRNLAVVTDGIAEELADGFEHVWGTSTEWIEIKVFDSVCKIVGRAANRAFLGPSLCRNDEFLYHALKYSVSIFGGGTFINMFPPFLRPLVGRLVALSGRRHLAICKKHCQPVVEERLQNMRQKMADPDFAWKPPQDGLQWIIEECYKTQDAKQLDPELITRRMLLINTISVHSTSVTTTNALLDLFSCPSVDSVIEGLREECNRVLGEAGGVWTKAAVSKLIRADSTIRESMRLDTNFIGLPRRVSAPEGITIDGKIHLSQGTRLGIPSNEIHSDHSLYNEASQFDAFRFSRAREISSEDSNININIHPTPIEDGQEEEETATTTAIPQTHSGMNSLVTTSDSFLAFGYGKHACPGRFFAAHEMKLMLAHLVQYYDVEPLPERPAQQPLMDGGVPPQWATLRVRRRKNM